jgi:hypothetical protein
MLRSVLILATLAACGSKAPSSPQSAPPTGQDLTDAVSRLCATPMRAQGDLEYSTGDASAKAAVLAKHLPDGITNKRVLDTIHNWSDPSKTTEQKVAELDTLTNDGLLSSKCQLREVWAAPPEPPK